MTWQSLSSQHARQEYKRIKSPCWAEKQEHTLWLLFGMDKKKLSYFFAVAEDVHFVDQEDHLFAPLANILQKSHLTVCERSICRQHTCSD